METGLLLDPTVHDSTSEAGRRQRDCPALYRMPRGGDPDRQPALSVRPTWFSGDESPALPGPSSWSRVSVKYRKPRGDHHLGPRADAVLCGPDGCAGQPDDCSMNFLSGVNRDLAACSPSWRQRAEDRCEKSRSVDEGLCGHKDSNRIPAFSTRGVVN